LKGRIATSKTVMTKTRLEKRVCAATSECV